MSVTKTQTVPTFKEEVSPGRVLTMPADGSGLSVLDPWLNPFDDALRERYAYFF
jgi:1,4-alpha-glucan branching enzyme